MKQECNSENENHSITWGKAYLYALGWLICWGISVIPIVWHSITKPGGIRLIIFVGLFLFLGLVMYILRYVHHSWRVSIALFIEVTVTSGIFFLTIYIVAMQALRGKW